MLYVLVLIKPQASTTTTSTLFGTGGPSVILLVGINIGYTYEILGRSVKTAFFASFYCSTSTLGPCPRSSLITPVWPARESVKVTQACHVETGWQKIFVLAIIESCFSTLSGIFCHQGIQSLSTHVPQCTLHDFQNADIKPDLCPAPISQLDSYQTI